MAHDEHKADADHQNSRRTPEYARVQSHGKAEDVAMNSPTVVNDKARFRRKCRRAELVFRQCGSQNQRISGTTQGERVERMPARRARPSVATTVFA